MLDLVKLESCRLSNGGHKTPSEGFCAMEAYAWACGLPHSDFPPCLPRSIAKLFQRINDWSGWTSDEERTAWLLPRMMRLAAIPEPPTREMERRIVFALADYAVRVCAPEALDAAGLKDKAANLRACLPIVDRDTALAGKRAASAYASAARHAGASAYASAASAATAYAASAAVDAAYAAAAAASAAAVDAYTAAASAAAVDAYAHKTTYLRHTGALIDRAVTAASATARPDVGPVTGE